MVIFFALLSTAMFNISYAQSNNSWSVNVGDTITWKVVIAPNTTFWWWDNDTGTPRLYKVAVNIGDIMQYNITSINGNVLKGDFKIGNLTATDVTSTTIGMNLVFGLWPFITGPVVETNWTAIEEKASEYNVQISTSQFDIYLGLPRETKTFENTTENGAFKLVYEVSSGVMLYGYGKYGKYELGVVIISTSVPLGVSSLTYAAIGVPLVIVIAGVILFIAKRKK